MPIDTEPYLEQSERWPREGRVILAQFDDDTVVVYQAYRPAIARFALEHGYFGGEFKLGRMTWIKPNFLWMMYRSSWGQSEGQEVVLAIRLKRSAFDGILRDSVHSMFRPDVYGTEERWRERVAASEIRLQWDPDHAPDGAPLARRAVQLGIRGESAVSYSRDWIVSIEDMSPLVAEQRGVLREGDLSQLTTPREHTYPVADDVARHLELDHRGDPAE